MRINLSKKLFGALLIVTAFFALSVFAVSAHHDDPTPTPKPTLKITLCHWDNGQGGKWTSNDVNINSVSDCQDANGHGYHFNDIIPAFTYQTCTYSGKNLSANFSGVTGQAILDNGCNIPTTTPTPTPRPSVTPNPTPTCTPTPQPYHFACNEDRQCVKVWSSGESTCDKSDDCKAVVTATPTPEPTVTPIITQTVTPTPTQAPSNGGNPGGPGDGKSDGRSDGGSSCPSCTQAPQGQVLGASTGPTQAVLGASTGPAVLGLSTTSGEESALPGLFQIFGALTSAGLGFAFFKKNA
jgi:hypothetical protein